MSKSFDINVNFNFRAVFSKEDLENVAEAVENAKLSLAGGLCRTKEQRGVCEAVVKASEKGTDEVLKVFLKDSVKQIRQEVLDAVKGDATFSRFSPFYAEYKPRVNRGPKWTCGCAATCHTCKRFTEVI